MQELPHGCKPPGAAERSTRPGARTTLWPPPHPHALLTSCHARGPLSRSPSRSGAQTRSKTPTRCSPENPRQTQTVARSPQALMMPLFPAWRKALRGFPCARCRGQLVPALRSIPACPPLRYRACQNRGWVIFHRAEGDVGRCPAPKGLISRESTRGSWEGKRTGTVG